MSIVRQLSSIAAVLFLVVCQPLAAQEKSSPLAGIEEVMQAHRVKADAIREKADEELERVREDTIKELKELQAAYTRDKQLDEALLVREQIQRLEEGGDATIVGEPQNPAEWRGRAGESFVCVLTGRTTGSLWGTGIYTDDSDLATAAVHGGVLRDGETGVVRVTIVAPAAAGYLGSTQNGVTSSGYGEWGGAYRIDRADVELPAVRREVRDPSSLSADATTPGRVLYYEVTGSTAGTVWGTDVYTTDSSLAAAAVHAGVLRDGEKGTVKVTALAGRDSYMGSSKNGVTTHSWGSYSWSFRVERAKEEKKDEKKTSQ